MQTASSAWTRLASHGRLDLTLDLTLISSRRRARVKMLLHLVRNQSSVHMTATAGVQVLHVRSAPNFHLCETLGPSIHARVALQSLGPGRARPLRRHLSRSISALHEAERRSAQATTAISLSFQASNVNAFAQTSLHPPRSTSQKGRPCIHEPDSTYCSVHCGLKPSLLAVLRVRFHASPYVLCLGVKAS